MSPAWSFLVILASLTAAEAFPDGAPAAACETLTPDHADNTAQTSAAPYEIDLSVFENKNDTDILEYTPGETYMLSLMSTESRDFEGFIIQTRVKADESLTGTFATDDTGVTHSEEVHRTDVQFNWTAPAAGTGSIHFGFSVVHDFEIFWADQRTAEIMEAGSTEDSASGLAVSMLCLLLTLVPLLV